jgi:D-lactate dehydrogenase (cytochrome)
MDLVDLLVGSEGTLATVVAAELRVVERPQPVLTLAAFLAAPEAAFSLADDVRDYASVLSIEYFDARALSFIRTQYPETPEAGACVLFEMEYAKAGRHNPYPGPSVLDRWDSLLTGHDSQANWVAAGEELRGMKAFRHALPEEVNRWVAARQGKLGTDMAVPAGAFPAMHEAYREAQDQGIRTVLFGHLGQYHLHLNFLPEDAAEMDRAREAYRGLARRAVRLGGTISAEHGAGKKRLRDETGRERPYLFYLYGDEGLDALARVKAVFDPQWLLNRGTMVPEA